MPESHPAVDRAWRGYDPRAAAPVVAAAAAASAAVLAGRWHLPDLSALAERVGALVLYALALAPWLAVLAAVYRMVTYTYRLTSRAVLVDRGSRWRPEPAVPLADVTGVTSGAGWLGRRLGVGWVRVEATGGRVLTLTGVRDPAGFAAAVREAAEAKES